MPLYRSFLVLAALLGGTAVAGGAFATHALRDQLSETSLRIFETGIRYQMYHALALLGIALMMERASISSSWLVTAGWAFVGGVLMFSGSLYTLSLSQLKILGAVAPIGGVALILGWGALAGFALMGDQLR